MTEVAPRGQHLVIAGDLFDTWRRHHSHDDCMALVATKIQWLHQQGVPTTILRGNRDYALTTAEVTQLHASEGIEPWHHGDDRAVAFTHGDIQCTADLAYLRWVELRSLPGVTEELLTLDLPQLAQRTRDVTALIRGSLVSDPSISDMYDVTHQGVKALIEHTASAVIIHGHTHRPGAHLHQLSNHQCVVRYVLGDWGKKVWWLERDDASTRLLSRPATSFYSS